MMDKMLNTPKNREPRNPLRLVVLMGIAVVLFLMAASQIGQVADMVMLP
mgnify:CR=1 FL=1